MASAQFHFPVLTIGAKLRVIYSGSFYDKVEEEGGEFHGVIASMIFKDGSLREITFTDGRRLSFVGPREAFPSGYVLGDGLKVVDVELLQ